MPHYLVSWEIDIDAPSAHEAARQAHEMVRRHDTTATVYGVTEHDGSGEGVSIDLSEDREFTIWSCHGLWRTALESELANGKVVKAALQEIEADLEQKGYCLTWCDVEPVAVFPWYPDQEPAEVLAWVNQGGEPDE